VIEKWTTQNIPDLTGRVIIVTGANSGIGYEAAKEFARKGAQTILASRSVDKAQGALSQIWKEIPNAKVEIMQLDLASQRSIHAFAEAFKSNFARLDVLVNNAGIMMVRYGTTEDGFERQFGTNHLGHFALTGLLIDVLKHTPNSRVVNVSSNGHRQGTMDFDNLMFKGGKGYSPMGAYGRTKLANLLFTYELQRRFEETGMNSIATAAHPGLTNTDLADHLPGVKLLRPFVGWIIQNAAMGALPTLRAAVDPAAKGGQYFGPAGPGETGGYPIVVRSNRASHDKSDAQLLWRVSEELTGVKFL
jgi:NAD(P)-dependent dehydrogenase (short-subunit alcohol dehydrogenase family)